jgi:hypothetical protein
VDFHGEKRSNETHESRTDPDARLARKSGGPESKLAYCGNVLIENRNGLVVGTELLQCNGTAERDAAMLMVERVEGTGRITLGGDKGYDSKDFVKEMRGMKVTRMWRRTRTDRAAAPLTDAPCGTMAARSVRGNGNASKKFSAGSRQWPHSARHGIVVGTSGVGVHLHNRRVQPREDAQSAVAGGSINITRGRSAFTYSETSTLGLYSPRGTSPRSL